VTFRESFNDTFPMFPRALWQITGDAGVQDAIASVGDEINPTTCHATLLKQDVDGRDKPGHDGGNCPDRLHHCV
jgi:hypothetical protein